MCRTKSFSPTLAIAEMGLAPIPELKLTDLVKPLDVKKLLTTLEKQLGKRQTRGRPNGSRPICTAAQS